MNQADAARFSRTRVRDVLLGIIILSAAGPPAYAQDTCARLITDAADAYRIGRLDETIQLTDACLKKRPSSDEQERVHTLRANAFLALDEIQQAEAAVLLLLRVNPEFTPAVDDSERFRVVVARLKRERAADAVSSVSKMRESLLEAPATVVVVTAEQIRRRGYLSLEAILHDLPGFDIARTNGQTYSNAYQRGYRSDATNRTLFLVDGVEQNDLFSNIAYISRQYPLSNVDRVEVVYGPASTMYGANAFLGVINIVTRDPDDMIGDGKTLGGDVRLGGGVWDTGYVDGTVAGRFRGASYAVTGRLFRSDEWDLSGYAPWNYSSKDVDYTQKFKRLEGFENLMDLIAKARALDQAALQALNGQPVTYSDLSKDWMVSGKLKVRDFLFGAQFWQTQEGTVSASTKWTEPGARNGAVWVPFQGAFFVRYSTALRGNVRLTYFGQAKVHELQPQSSSFLLHSYKVQLDIFDLCRDDFFRCQVSKTPFWTQTYLAQSSSQVRNELNVVVRPRSNIDFITGLDVRNSSVQTDYSKSSNCITPTPTRLFEGTNRDPAAFFGSFVPSIFSSEEEDRAYLAAGQRGGPFLGLEDGRASCEGKEEEGLQRPSGGGEHRALRDIGIFGQLSYRPTRSVKVVAGWRMDNGRVDLNRGYGTVTTPRLAFVYSPGPFVAKVTYAEAFKEPANLERFSTIPPIRNVAGTDLQPERVRNLEIAVGRQTATYGIDLAAYRARYSNVIGVTESSAYEYLNTAEFHNFADRLAEEWYFTLCSYYDCLATALRAIPELEVRQRAAEYLLNNDALSLSFDNRAALDVVGAQINGTWRWKNVDVFGNYSFTDPRPKTGENQAQRASDIARHRANVGTTAGSERLNVGLRFNLVSSRPRPDASTDSQHGVLAYLASQGNRQRFDEAIVGETAAPSRIPGYTLAHLTATYAPLRGLAVQAVVENVFNASYVHPGVQAADDVRFAASIPQPGRAVFVQLVTRF